MTNAGAIVFYQEPRASSVQLTIQHMKPSSKWMMTRPTWGHVGLHSRSESILGVFGWSNGRQQTFKILGRDPGSDCWYALILGTDICITCCCLQERVDLHMQQHAWESVHAFPVPHGCSQITHQCFDTQFCPFLWLETHVLTLSSDCQSALCVPLLQAKGSLFAIWTSCVMLLCALHVQASRDTTCSNPGEWCCGPMKWCWWGTWLLSKVRQKWYHQSLDPSSALCVSHSCWGQNFCQALQLLSLSRHLVFTQTNGCAAQMSAGLSPRQKMEIARAAAVNQSLLLNITKQRKETVSMLSEVGHQGNYGCNVPVDQFCLERAGSYRSRCV